MSQMKIYLYESEIDKLSSAADGFDGKIGKH